MKFKLAVVGAACLIGLPIRAAARTIMVSTAGNIDAALRQANRGDTALLAPGVYRLDQPLAPRSGTRLEGAGQDKTVLQFGSATPGALIELSDRDGVSVTALTLDGGSSVNAYWGIHAHRAANLSIRHVTIRNLVKNDGGPLGIAFTGDNPTYANGVTDSVIADCIFENMGPTSEWGGAIRLSWGSSRNAILRNTIRNTGRGGIFGNDRSTDLVIQGNEVTGSHGEGLGIEVWGGCDRSIIEDNRIDHWLSIGGCDLCAVRRNVIGDDTGVIKYLGIEVIGSQCVIADNQVTGGQQIGLSVSNNDIKKQVFWKNDIVRNCIQWGAQLQGDRTGLAEHYFYRCQFLNNRGVPGKSIYPNDSGHGFRFNENARDVVFEECRFEENAGLGIQVNGSPIAPVNGLLFLHCRIFHNGGAALATWPGIRGLEFEQCAVGENGNNALPAANPVPGSVPAVSAFIPARARVGPVDFRATALGQGVRYLWDFGDGAPSTAAAPRHTYSRPGAYDVTLIAWGANGRAVRKEGVVRVSR